MELTGCVAAAPWDALFELHFRPLEDSQIRVEPAYTARAVAFVCLNTQLDARQRAPTLLRIV